MLDKRCLALLNVINAECLNSGYRVFAIEELVLSMPKHFGVEASEVLTRMAPATVLGNVTAIVLGGILNNYGRNHPSVTGYGTLVNDGKEVKKPEPVEPTLMNLFTGMILSFAFYQLGALLHRFVEIVPTYAQALNAMHMGTTRYLKCPKCNKRTWCKKVWKK